MKKLINRMIFGRSDNPDITPEQLDKRTKVKIFFDTLRNSISDIVKLNFILIVFSLPLIVWVIFNTFMIDNADTIQITLQMLILFIGLVPCLLILAPALGGASYVLRQIVREKYVLIWSDFWKHAKSNAKQSVIYMLALSIFILIVGLGLNGYQILVTQQQNFFVYSLRALFAVVAMLVMLSSIYSFPMIATYDLKIKDIIKNSIIFTFTRFLGTLTSVVLSILPLVIIIAISFLFSNLGFFLLLAYILCIGFSLMLYVQMMFINEVFNKYLGNKKREINEKIEA